MFYYIEKDGRTCETIKLNMEEHYQILKEKLMEEVTEFIQGENVQDLEDIYEVIAALSEFVGEGEEELMKVREEKREERGGFREGIVLKSTK